MRALRRVVGRVAVVWLLCHAATLSLATAILVTGEHQLECQCGHGEHAYCPMHHKPAPGEKLCFMEGATDFTATVVTSLFGVAGLMPGAAPSFGPPPAQALLPAAPVPVTLRSAPPDSPPPRI